MEANISSVTITASQVLAKERNAFDSQQKYFDETRLRTDAILDEVKDDALPLFDADLRGSGDLVLASTVAVRDAGERTDRDLESLEELTRALGARVNDPAIGESLQHIDEATANLAATALDTRKVADHYAELVMKPASKVKAAVLFSASVVGRILRIL
jgi:hypothetical protein